MKIIKTTIILILLFALCSCGEKTYSGALSYSGICKDEEFGVEIDAPILIRNVEMVQYIKNKDGKAELVLANYPIGSFDNYDNPEFPIDIISEVFYGDITLNDIQLSEDLIKAIAYSDIEKETLYELPDINLFGFIYHDGYYSTAHNDWQLGDIKISYQYINKDKILSINAKLSDNILQLSNKFIISE